jgi:death-on-curing protein
MRYLTLDELVYINDRVTVHSPIHTIVEGKRKVRAMDLLEAAWGRPMQTVFGQDAYPTLVDKAAALLHSLVRNHPFADGNKRTAAIALIFMLAVNGQQIIWDEADAVTMIVQVAEGKRGLADFTAWLSTRPGGPPLDADADSDMALIGRIMADHHGLLAELAGQ